MTQSLTFYQWIRNRATISQEAGGPIQMDDEATELCIEIWADRKQIPFEILYSHEIDDWVSWLNDRPWSSVKDLETLRQMFNERREMFRPTPKPSQASLEMLAEVVREVLIKDLNGPGYELNDALSRIRVAYQDNIGPVR